MPSSGPVAAPSFSKRELEKLARVHTAEAIALLAGVVRNPREKTLNRIIAAKDLLDRGWGKASAHIRFEGDDGANSGDEILQAMRESARLAADSMARRMSVIDQMPILQGDTLPASA